MKRKKIKLENKGSLDKSNLVYKDYFTFYKYQKVTEFDKGKLKFDKG